MGRRIGQATGGQSRREDGGRRRRRRRRRRWKTRRRCEGVLYADDAGIASRDHQAGWRGLLRTVIVTACSASWPTGLGGQDGDNVSLQTKYTKVSFTITTAGQAYKQTVAFGYLGEAISADGDLSVEITRRLQRARACLQRYKMGHMTVRVCACGGRCGC